MESDNIYPLAIYSAATESTWWNDLIGNGSKQLTASPRFVGLLDGMVTMVMIILGMSLWSYG
jgi:hypothetical protein